MKRFPLFPTAIAVMMHAVGTSFLLANPQGLAVQSGSATTANAGSQLNVTVSQNAFLNWDSFNIGAGETTTFFQPSASSVVWNRVADPNPSRIFGTIQANGVVVLMNQAGFYFGPQSFVNAAGLVVSTAPGVPWDAGGGMFWQFNGTPPHASIINYGQLSAGPGGSLFLIAQHVENHGTLSAPQGSVGLAAAQEVMLSSRPDGRGLSAAVQLPSGAVDNSGRIMANAGTVALHAQVVNQGGLIQADSLRERNGTIELVASEAVNLHAQSVISATGDSTSASGGGQVTIQSGGTFADSWSSRVSVAGSSKGGNGGTVEISAPELPAVRSIVDGHAGPGGLGGRLLLDPQDIVLGSSGAGVVDSGTVTSPSPPVSGALNLDVNSAFLGFSQIDLQATRNITLSAGVTWDLASSTGVNSPGSQLKLEAGNNITLANGSSIVAGPGWAITLQAGRNFSSSDAVIPGTGNLSMSGTASLQAGDGDVSVLAGNNVTVAGGFIRTVAGGNISVQALGGSINTGSKPNGFLFLPTGYVVDPDLGGISTAGGGNVRLTAGLDITSFLPLAGGVQSDAGSGAFGKAPGNVTVTAGRDVSGHYVVRNGTGSVDAGRDAGTSTKLLALSLVKGGWTVDAAQDIFLQEVRNPNGVFNDVGFGSSTTKHLFDYAPDAYVDLQAGDSVQLLGTALPRYLDTFEQGIPAIYPGTLTIAAGEGGVTLGNDLILFPSPIGNLKISTTAGGSLLGNKPGDLVQLILSDSGKSQYRAFGDFGIADHADSPLHLNDGAPVFLDIAGNLNGILLGVPKRANVTVGCDMINSRFQGQNLSDADVTSITVAGDILNRNEFTSVTVNAPPNFALLDLVYPSLSGTLVGLQNQFFYNPTTHALTFQGRMTGDQLQTLLNIPVRVFDPNGAPVLQPDGQPMTRNVPLLDAAAANALYSASQDVPLNPETGYRIGGGGTFQISAHNLDLGATAGIISTGPRDNPALATLFTHGAAIQVALSGNLDMFSTEIASLNGGAITVTAGGDINVGSRDFVATSEVAARGIFTVDPSDVTVVATGNIDVNGSRIAGYDGGNVTVRSLQGNVDAGTGASGAATVEKVYVDPLTHQILTYAPTIPGSGILATTFPPSLDPSFPSSLSSVGNILVETPHGNIIASAGGILQIPLNNVGNNAGSVTLRAGTKDASGNVLFAGDIDATGSGVIGSTVTLEASGKITGLVFARQNLDISAQQSVNVTALAQGNVNVSAGGTVSGTVIGVGSVTASGSAVDAALLSQNVNISGNVTSSQVGFGQANAAGATSQGLQSEDPGKTLASSKTSGGEDDLTRKHSGPRMTKTSGRVTIVSPKIN